jgi:cysteine desulfurase/selenocysteine lyase
VEAGFPSGFANMTKQISEVLDQVRNRFAHVDECPFTGPRVFFENAGGALTLKSAVETSAKFAAIPDNQGRDNPASHALVDVINTAKQKMRLMFNAPGGQFFVGESGTELLFRIIRTAIVGAGHGGAGQGGAVIGTTLEHPASRSAATYWANEMGCDYIAVPHDNATGTVTADDYAKLMTPDVRVATIIHTSPVTGMGVDIEAVAKAIRAVSPECYIIVDGIQHASHGHIDIAAAGIDGYAVSPYKVFSRHGYGVGWASDRLTELPRERLNGGPETNWEFGTRDTGAYATFTDVVDYLIWLGSNFTDSTHDRARIEAAGKAIHDHEKLLTDAMLHGTGNLKGLAEMPGVTIIGGVDNPAREGLVSLTVDGVPALDVVEALNAQGIRTHTRKADHYSGNVLEPLGLDSCVRVSMCHYNTQAEVAQFLAAMADIVPGARG